jgi:plasmid stabilization system protein ParE
MPDAELRRLAQSEALRVHYLSTPLDPLSAQGTGTTAGATPQSVDKDGGDGRGAWPCPSTPHATPPERCRGRACPTLVAGSRNAGTASRPPTAGPLSTDWDYIHQAAFRFRKKADRVLRRLSKVPESGRLIPEFADLPYREAIVPPYRFFYRREGRTIWVVACWHGGNGE